MVSTLRKDVQIMKRLFLPLAALATVAVGFYVAAEDKPKSGASDQSKTPPKNATKTEAVKKPVIQPAKPAQEKTPSSATDPVPATGADPGRSPYDESVRRAVAALVASYNKHDAKAFAGAFTADGEYVDEKRTIFHGQAAIEGEFTRFFTDNPSTGIEATVASTRSIGQSTVATDGSTRFTRAKGEPAVAGRCHIVLAMESGKWLIASLQEIEAADEHTSHHEQVKQLEFLVGEWINEGSDSHVHFTCRWDDGQNFLLRDFAVHFAGQKTMTGTQRIGYDPLTGHLKAWIFDSAGGYGDGYFHGEGGNWVLQTTGVTADGRMASGSQILTRVDGHRMLWQAVDYVIGGERIADIAKVTIVRKPPAPTARAKQD
jgi:uncharacterized protein (TIGR02246 family)